ncbi:MAG: MBL fold metallo-hydrolase [Chloroflexi bacterium]|nr:MBL fold metallo-hydrolase [Chloroflexota bacterium]
MQVADGVYQFKIPMPVNPGIPDGGLRYTLVYAIQVSQGWVVVDAGLNTDEGFGAFQGFLAEAGIAPNDIKLIFITHGHTDHAGLANRFKEYTGAPVAMHRLDVGQNHNPMGQRDPQAVQRWMHRYGVPDEEVQQGFLNRPHMGPRGQDNAAWHTPNPRVDILLEGGEELLPGSNLWAVWTPGHSPGHICVYDKGRKLLFSGDHILPTITPHVSLFPGEEGNPLASFINGHKELRKLDAVAVHPAHEYSMPDLKKRIDEILEHHRERLHEVLATLQEGPKTAWEVAANIKWNVAPWAQLNAWTRRAAMMETLAHLQHLVMEGEIAKQEAGPVVTFSRR